MANFPFTETCIVLAEDNPADIELVREALADRQILCELQVVYDGEEALYLIERIEAEPTARCPALFLIDFHLPKKDAAEILGCLRSSQRCSRMPVVIMTSLASRREIEKTAPHQSVYYFRKPSTLSEFLALGDLVRTVLGADSQSVRHSHPAEGIQV